jgi:hypothetical protein
MGNTPCSQSFQVPSIKNIRSPTCTTTKKGQFMVKYPPHKDKKQSGHSVIPIPGPTICPVFHISVTITMITTTTTTIIILVITCMHGIYNYIPETNHVSVVCSVEAVLYLQSVLHVMLFCPCNMFCTFT